MQFLVISFWLTFLLLQIKCILGDLEGLHFYLFTRTNPSLAQKYEVKASDTSSISSSPFVKRQPVKILVHGYTASYTQEFPNTLKNYYLEAPNSFNYNVISVDWNALCNGAYPVAFNNTPLVGKEIATLMTKLIAMNYSALSDFHFIGHSLGGQVGAFISQNLANGQLIPRVTGLDPARPGFESSLAASQRLDPTDAVFVDVIRTSPGVGSNSTTPDPPTGTADFYPNGGLKQRGCALLDIATSNLCSHIRSYKLYMSSVQSNASFNAYKCNSYSDFKGTCAKTVANMVIMGEYVSWSAKGTYYLDTTATSPYAKGTVK